MRFGDSGDVGNEHLGRLFALTRFRSKGTLSCCARLRLIESEKGAVAKSSDL
jgi:hypothetical protein